MRSIPPSARPVKVALSSIITTGSPSSASAQRLGPPRGELQIDGDGSRLVAMLSLLDAPDPDFSIVTP